MKILMKTGFILFLVVTINFVGDSTCENLFDNCIASAQQAYNEGTYSADAYVMFRDEICPDTYVSCIFSEA